MNIKNLTLALVLMAFIGSSSSIAFAENGNGDRPEQIKESKPSATLTVEQIACIKTAITKREDALIAGHGGYTTAISSAYMARKTALLLAWDKPTPGERRTAVKTADRAFYEATKSARTTWNTARRSAWKAFETSKKDCKVVVGAAETGNSQSDASL